MSNIQINCACVIHGNLYPWQYVENLYAMLCRHLPCEVRLHVFTEANRSVPNHMIKHALQEWPGISGRKKAWWYKLQMFDPAVLPGQNLYFDLDTVVVDDLSWLTVQDTEYFWTIRDFRHMWKPNWSGINSSLMYWNSNNYSWIWQDVCKHGIQSISRQFRGDQDYLNSILPKQQIKFVDDAYVKSWRWQVFDGGLIAGTQQYRRPSAGAVVPADTKVIVFHGTPKPHEVTDQYISEHWNCKID